MNLSIKRIFIKEKKMGDPLEKYEEIHEKYFSSLLAGKGPKDISKYDIIGYNPVLIVKFDNQFTIKTYKTTQKRNKDFWNYLRKLVKGLDFSNRGFPINKLGFVGYLSFESFKFIEDINEKNLSNYPYPLLEIALYKNYILFDKKNRKQYEIELDYENYKTITETYTETAPMKMMLKRKEKLSEFKKDKYLENVKKIKEYIRNGDVYEVNLTQQFSFPTLKHPFDLFKKLYAGNPAPYSAFLNIPERQVISNSPEMFIKAKGSKVETRPIKGTAARNTNSGIDELNRKKLINSEKDQAELFMIIDLLRNDISKIAEVGSVKVKNSKRLEKYLNVYHLIGIVEAVMGKQFDYVDLLKAVFPGGSITGCPKKRSIEIIKELEKYERNLYTGTIFIMNKSYLNSSIAIRTAINTLSGLFINSGGAITIDSNPEDEYSEMLDKINNFMEILNEENFS